MVEVPSISTSKVVSITTSMEGKARGRKEIWIFVPFQSSNAMVDIWGLFSHDRIVMDWAGISVCSCSKCEEERCSLFFRKSVVQFSREWLGKRESGCKTVTTSLMNLDSRCWCCWSCWWAWASFPRISGRPMLHTQKWRRRRPTTNNVGSFQLSRAIRFEKTDPSSVTSGPDT